MPRKPLAPGGLAQFNIRVPEEIVEALDAIVEEQQAAHPGRSFTRSDLVREVLYEYVKARGKPKRKKP